MKRQLAARRMWGTGSWWIAEDPQPASVRATVVHEVHHYLHLPDGQVVELPEHRAALDPVSEPAPLRMA